jgi:hypothetical protein
MDIQLAMQLISSLGFPIFITIWLLKYQKETIDKLADVINQNTLAIQRLVDKLEKDSKEG